MDQGKTEKLYTGIETAFIDGSVVSDLYWRPQFLSNNYQEGKKVLSSVEEELLHCDQFQISVAFITLSGVEPLLQTFKELEKKGIKGRILTTDYLNFSQPKALEKLNGLDNIELRMYKTDGEREGFHTKGYIFQKEGRYNIILGSSNMTASALTINKEWNARVISAEKGEFAQNLLREFDSVWNSEKSLRYEDYSDHYKTKYEAVQEQRKRAAQEGIPSIEQYTLEPNSMQVEFIRNLHELVEEGEKKALLISATGTGKTYASAFALRNEDPKRILFIVHREQIARQALESYRKVFGSGNDFGIVSGSHKDFDNQYVFATMQMMAKQESLDHYDPKAFDVIVIDEVHRAGADSYQRIMSHFTPKLWLGMTASPERTDGYDIYSLFDHNIAYEIRLQQALEEDLLCPFHYFGITEVTIDGELLGEDMSFSNLTSDERVDHIIREAEYYGYSGDRVRGLVFCSGKEEAKELSSKFNARGYRTEFICGDDSQETREKCIERLTGNNTEDALDYIFTIDIFNEGVDIPEINQVIMLRSTQSPIIFVQQLGRGLRKAKDKEFVVVLDFIGNYENNYMIPIALSGDRSYNKDNMRKYVAEGTRIIPGSSSIHFDEIARSQIYESIDNAKTNTLKLLRDSYQNLKYKLGHIPTIHDFAKHGSIDVIKFFEKCGSYHNFLKKYEPDYTVKLNKTEEQIIEFISTKLATGKRIHELEMLNLITRRNDRLWFYYKKILKSDYGIELTSEEKQSLVLNLTNQFGKETERKKFNKCVFVNEIDQELFVSDAFNRMLEKNESFFYMVTELVSFGIERFKKFYSSRYKNTNLELYQKYTYEDVCRLLNWKTNMNAQNIGGYFYDKETRTLPVFINYEKDDDAIAYEDRFISNTELIALSKHPRRVDSTDADHFYKRTEADKDNRIYLFVRKNKDDQEAKEFYFLGEVHAVGEPNQIRMTTPEGKTDNAFEINYHMDVPVREDIYNFITGE